MIFHADSDHTWMSDCGYYHLRARREDGQVDAWVNHVSRGWIRAGAGTLKSAMAFCRDHARKAWSGRAA